MTNMSNKQRLERAAVSGWHLKASTDVILHGGQPLKQRGGPPLPVNRFTLAVVEVGKSEATSLAKRH